MNERKKVAIQGYEGSFHQIVAHRCLGENIEIHPCATFREVARQVESGEADYGVMAVENSIAGSILANLGILQKDGLQAVGEYYLRIRQNLMALPDVRLEEIEEVHSHPMALLQCVDFLDAHHWKLIETEDTALSARHIAERGIRNAAAIAGDLAAKLFGLKIIAIRDLIAYRLKQESMVERGPEVDMPTIYGHFRDITFRQKSNGLEHVALIKGTWEPDEPILVRVHSSCVTGDIFGSQRCDCGAQLHESMRMIEKEGKGIVLYMNQEGRGIGLFNKMKAYKLQEEGLDTVDANTHLGFLPDEREYGVGAQILHDLGVHKMRLLTNNPVKRVGLEAYGLEIVENVPIEVGITPYNEKYMHTKKDRMGHTLHFNK